MDDIINGFLEALYLLFTFDPEVWGIMILSIRVSGISTILATSIALPLASFLALREFRGKKIITNLINTFMGFPPVVMGLLIYLLLSNSGPFGFLHLLYTPTAMIIAQLFLAIPIITGTTKAAIENVNQDLKETIISLGATNGQLWWEIIKEEKKPIISGVLVAFGQAISEVGAVMIVGGNIRWNTRTFTTTIVLQTRMGEFGFAIAIGLLLIMVSFIINYFLTHLQQVDN